MPKLTVQNAEIRTASVEIKTLTVSGKQVTQAVFKQLPERRLVADDGTLNGVPWGRVNYHPDKCDEAPHLHVVWEVGKELLRSRVDLEVTYPRWIEAESAQAWVDAKVREDATSILIGWEPLADEFSKKFLGVAVRMVMSREAEETTRRRAVLERARCVVEACGPQYWVPTNLTGLAAARAAASAAAGRPHEDRSVPGMTAEHAVAAAEDGLQKALAILPTDPLIEVEARLIAEVRGEADRRRRHREVREALTSLPQLFIAV